MNSNYDLSPSIPLKALIHQGWNAIAAQVLADGKLKGKKKKVIVIECYTGILFEELIAGISLLKPDLLIDSRTAQKTETVIRSLTWPDVTDDRIFGFMTRLIMDDFLDPGQLRALRARIDMMDEGVAVIFGPGAALIPVSFDLLLYADMARWEIQLRMRRNRVSGLGIDDHLEEFSLQYKRGYFVDWRVCDRLKERLWDGIDYYLDTNRADFPKMLAASALKTGLRNCSERPFRVVPYFDPGPWGGQWMKKVCGLDPDADNYAWCFDCVPEENSLLFNAGGIVFETPSVNLVLFESQNLLGKSILDRFGREFPIRFDFLDTMGGGNLSLQVHPLTSYIREKFGMSYTQDESYYLLDAGEDATVYLGIRDGADPEDMISALRDADAGGPEFKAEDFVNIWPARKHDHFLIPAGTVHCSGKNAMVLEISATPYIFTFKLWDWARPGLDGKPRPINIDHAARVIQWNRRSEFTRRELVSPIEPLTSGDGWREEKTGLHKLEFIETHRHWFTGPVLHNTRGTVNVLNLVEGREAIITSPKNRFDPFVVHYAETFIIPAAVGEYEIAPHGESVGLEIATIKAFVRL
ncbi:MAG: mannose-6-phosphate isomerase [Bacteroidetes bacterium GWF2_49_14]|nr:MAG: mannose-6-phosphate isomerase [Bacteroidetes bacterium GWF2_49_14]